MAIKSVVSKRRDSPIAQKRTGNEQHVLCFGALPYQPQGDGTSGTCSWKPVKDLVRYFLPRNTRDEPNVQIVDGCDGKFQPWAYVRLKKEANARRVFDRIAGHTWYGTVLTVTWFFSPSTRILRLLDIGYKADRPEALENHSQIRDRTLLRRCQPTRYSRPNVESIAGNAMRIAMTVTTNWTAPCNNHYGPLLQPQIRMSDPAYRAATSQPWSYTDLNNQTHTWNTGLLLNQVPAQWMYPTCNTLLPLPPAFPMGGFNMAAISAYPMPSTVMPPPMALAPQHLGNLDHLPMKLNTNLNIRHGRYPYQPIRTAHYPTGRTTGKAVSFKKSQDVNIKTSSSSNSGKSSDVLVYNPPVIVDGSKRRTSRRW